jgi:voltage-gated potassium channel
MISFFITLGRLIRVIWRGLRDPEFRALLLVFVLMLFSATVFYSRFEGWGVIDSLYFSVVTLATVGYGDLVPVTPIGKVFTIIYLLVGVGVFVAMAGKIAAVAMARRDE